MKRLFVGMIAASLMLVGIAGPATARPGNAGPPAGVVPGEQTIADIVIASATADDPEEREFTLLLAAIQYIAETNPDSALIAGLFNSDQYTVFAPTDAAFVALLEATGLDSFAAIDDALFPGAVEAVVSYHVTDGRRASNSVLPRRGERTISTLLDGATFSVDSKGGIAAVGNSANIVAPNISASNGVIHVIDTVILPIEL